jgi:hypothetical protein
LNPDCHQVALRLWEVAAAATLMVAVALHLFSKLRSDQVAKQTLYSACTANSVNEMKGKSCSTKNVVLDVMHCKKSNYRSGEFLNILGRFSEKLGFGLNFRKIPE